MSASRMVFRRLRPVAFAGALLLFQVGASAAPELSTDSIANADWRFEFGRWAFTQGALAAVLLVVLWSYRRDYARLSEAFQRDTASERDHTTSLVLLVEKGTAAQERGAAASEAVEKSMHRLARSVEQLVAGQQRGRQSVSIDTD